MICNRSQYWALIYW